MSAMFPQNIHDKSFLEEFERNFHPSNEILPDDDQKTIRSLLSESRSTLDSIDDEIRAVKESLQALIDRRAKEVARMERLHNGIALYKAIPPEVLSSIFIHALDGNPTAVTWKSNNCPWNLIQVCSRWRTVGLCDDRLWKTVVFFATTFPIFSAHDSPITIQSRNSILETLIVKIYHFSMDLGFILAQFSQCQKLRNIEIEAPAGVALHLSDMHSNIFPWAQITSLRFDPLTGIDPATILEILHRCVHLITVEFTFSGMIHSEDFRHVKMTHLRSLRINARYHHQVGQFLQFLTLPLLEKFTLHGESNKPFDGPRALEGLVQLIKRSCCSITYFVLQDVQFVPGDIELALVSMPELKLFDIGGARERISDSTLNRMKDEALVQNLEVFCARVTSFHACREMVESRFSARENKRMSVVVIFVDPGDYERDLEEHEQFITQHQVGGRMILVEPRSL